jgi:hypothetical protein
MTPKRRTKKAQCRISVTNVKEMLPCLQASANGPFETVRSHAPRVIAGIVSEAQTAEAEDQLLNKVVPPGFKYPIRTNKIYFLETDSEPDCWGTAPVPRRGS